MIEIRLLSAGAVKAGVHAFELLVKRDLGLALSVEFNTAPRISERLAAGERFDILISPPHVIDQAVKNRLAAAETRVTIGRVGAGIVVRRGALLPNVGTVEALAQALLHADSVVYNSASTGIHLEKLFAQLGLLDQLKAKSTRYAEGAAVMEHVINGQGEEIGFGALTEIRRYLPKGLILAGPLPAGAQNCTSYEAVLMREAASADAGKSVLHLLATPAAKAAFSDAGIE